MNKICLLIATGLIAFICCISTSCKKDEEASEEEALEEVEETVRSDFITPGDSSRWLGYLAYSPEDTALAYLMMGSLYLANNAPEGAIHYLNLASRFDPDRSVINLNLGLAYNNLGDYEKALESFRLYLQRNPGNILSQDIFRIAEKYRSILSESEIP